MSVFDRLTHGKVGTSIRNKKVIDELGLIRRKTALGLTPGKSTSKIDPLIVQKLPAHMITSGRLSV